ncbi:hypothetical protein LXL04_017829 [Taraxacum kok-saghyz]
MISFSTGKHGCPAAVLGSSMTTLMLARMLQGYTWEVPCNDRPIKLVEKHDGLSLAKPLVLIAKPRLPQHVFRRFVYKKTLSNRHPLPPGPMSLPFIGCTIQMLLNQPTSMWIHKLMDDLNTQILCIRLGSSTHIITVSSPELAREFFKTQDAIFISRPDFYSTYLVSDGYRATALSPHGEQWRKMRRIIILEMLSSQVHKRFQPKRDEEAFFFLNSKRLYKTTSNVLGTTTNGRSQRLQGIRVPICPFDIFTKNTSTFQPIVGQVFDLPEQNHCSFDFPFKKEGIPECPDGP